ncbi:dehydrodolichyl diphosphate synthase CPT3-like [Mercurialis annua]|uniref:dehydrodolichyl diphosphate synthase CPT3-like n=1 Tax=Mercurialis annua TaxID=3986 RepID=UPI00215EDE1F|nr:dehydrodolichyl diphosphate synthase CPT3-like [Mercurialis annua]
MKKVEISRARKIWWKIGIFLRKLLIYVISVGPIPTHVAFIMDGNRRYAKKMNLGSEAAGHTAGFLSLMAMLIYCCELHVKYVTAYAFSIDNFRRGQDEVQSIMDLIEEKIELLIQEDSIVHRYKVRVHFAGKLQLLSEPVKDAAQRLMASTSDYTTILLTICVAYSSTDEIMHAIQESCEEKRSAIGGCKLVQIVDMEKHMYMETAPDPDILVRTSGVDRLSNFLLWQSSCCYLESIHALWPEICLGHLIWAVIKFQQNYSYLAKKKKLLFR